MILKLLTVVFLPVGTVLGKAGHAATIYMLGAIVKHYIPGLPFSPKQIGMVILTEGLEKAIIERAKASTAGAESRKNKH